MAADSLKLLSTIVLKFGPDTPGVGGQSLEFKVFDGDPNEAPTGGKVIGSAPAIAWKIGRTSSICDVSIPDRFISAIHFSLIFDPAYGENGEPAWLIGDGGYYSGELKRKGDVVPAGYKQSSGGTWLNGQQLGADSKNGLIKPKLQRIFPHDRIHGFPSIKAIVLDEIHGTELPCDVWAGDWRETLPTGKVISNSVESAISTTPPSSSQPWFIPVLKAIWVGPIKNPPPWFQGLWGVTVLIVAGCLAAIAIPHLIEALLK